MRFRRHSEAGEGQFGCIIGLLILAAACLIAYKMIPIKVKASDLRQVIVDNAKSASMQRDKQIRADIMNKAADLELPLEDENLTINRAHGSIRIEADYTVPVEFPGYTYMWHFHHEAENPLF